MLGPRACWPLTPLCPHGAAPWRCLPGTTELAGLLKAAAGNGQSIGPPMFLWVKGEAQALPRLELCGGRDAANSSGLAQSHQPPNKSLVLQLPAQLSAPVHSMIS